MAASVASGALRSVAWAHDVSTEALVNFSNRDSEGGENNGGEDRN